MIVAGWIAWALLALYTATLWFTKFTNPNGGIRLFSGRCAFWFTLILGFSLEYRLPLLHLLWIAPLVYLCTMAATGQMIDARLKTAPKRAEAQSKKTGEPVEAILQREMARLGYGQDGPGNPETQAEA